MNQLDALLRVEASNIKDVKGLLALLCIKNPEYNEARRRSRFANVKEYNYYYDIDESTKSIFLPRNIPDRFFKNPQYKDNRSTGKLIEKGISDSFKLRPYQEPFIYGEGYVMDCINAGETDLTYIVQCGDGKTILGLYTAYMLQTNALIIVPTHQLATQWFDSAKEFFPDWTCGMYDDSKKTLYDLTITTYDLMSDKRFDLKFFSQFGITEFDEVHRIGADTYSLILSKTCTKFRISLTATFRRKDGTEEVLKYHCGKSLVLDRPRKKAVVIPLRTGISIDLRKYRTLDKRCTPLKQLSEYEEVNWRDNTDKRRDVILTKKFKDPKEKWAFKCQDSTTKEEFTVYEERDRLYRYAGISMAAIDSAIITIEERNAIILELIILCSKTGRKPIVLSKRKEILYTLCDRLLEAGIEGVGVICSKKAKDWRDYVKNTFGVTDLDEYEKHVLENCSIILGIDKIAKEGMDVDTADTLIFIHPEKDIEQAVGRILREGPNKREPLVFYPLDSISPYQNYYYGPDGAKKMFSRLHHKIFPEMGLAQFKKEFCK